MSSEVWMLWKEFKFEAAHKLEGHDGKCARLHGHSWVGRVYVSGRYLIAAGPKRNMLVDFSTIKNELVNPVVENLLDHHYLNETLVTDRPTSEYVAKFLFQHFSQRLQELAGTHEDLTYAKVTAVVIEETCTSGCRYERK